jgi:hypothetical protein
MKPLLSSDSDCVLLDTKITPGRVPFPKLDINSLVASQLHLATRRSRRSYEGNRHFQDSWAAKLPWVESVLGANGFVAQVKCRICSDVEGREKLLVPKIDGLWKHAGRRRALANFGNMKKGDFYFTSTNQHVKNEKIYFARGGVRLCCSNLPQGWCRRDARSWCNSTCCFICSISDAQ